MLQALIRPEICATFWVHEHKICISLTTSLYGLPVRAVLLLVMKKKQIWPTSSTKSNMLNISGKCVAISKYWWFLCMFHSRGRNYIQAVQPARNLNPFEKNVDVWGFKGCSTSTCTSETGYNESFCKAMNWEGSALIYLREKFHGMQKSRKASLLVRLSLGRESENSAWETL